MALFRRKKKEEGAKESPAVPAPVVEEKGGVVGAELIPVEAKPKSDVWTLLLILSFIFFCSAIYIAGKEIHEQYGWTAMGILGSEQQATGGEGASEGTGGAAESKQPSPPAGESKKQ